MGERMMAARFLGDRRVVVEDVDVPEPGPGEVLVRVDTCGLCGTDKAAWLQGSAGIPGHETAGTVVAVGHGAEATVFEGARGVVYLVAPCGRCAACRASAPNACQAKEAAYGFGDPGGFAEYVAVRADCFLRVDDDISLDVATCLLDLFGTTSHAFVRARRSPIGSVAVLGCGPIGLGAIAVAGRLGAPSIAAVDVSRYRLDLAARLGATPLDATSDQIGVAALDVAPGGFDVVIEAAGMPSTQRTALDICGPRGVVVIVAHCEEPLELRTSRDLISIERAIVGSEYFPPDEFSGVHDAVRAGELDPTPILTHRFGLERIAEACDVFFAGQTGKVLVRP